MQKNSELKSSFLFQKKITPIFWLSTSKKSLNTLLVFERKKKKKKLNQFDIIVIIIEIFIM